MRSQFIKYIGKNRRVHTNRGEQMNLLHALAISIGVLIVGWVYLSVGNPDLNLVVWAGVVGWGSFYAAGSGIEGLKKALAGNISGALWAFVALVVYTQLGGASVLTLAILVGLAAAGMVLQAKVTALSFIPGAFLGAATWVGASGGAELSQKSIFILVSLAAGSVLGFLSEAGGKKLANAE